MADHEDDIDRRIEQCCGCCGSRRHTTGSCDYRPNTITLQGVSAWRYPDGTIGVSPLAPFSDEEGRWSFPGESSTVWSDGRQTGMVSPIRLNPVAARALAEIIVGLSRLFP